MRNQQITAADRSSSIPRSEFRIPHSARAEDLSPFTGLPVVFVIDDDPSVRRALARLFKYEGFRVETFAAAQEFLSQPLPDSPACLILDVRMPGVNGLDLQTHLAERNARLPIVFITGHGDIPSRSTVSNCWPSSARRLPDIARLGGPTKIWPRSGGDWKPSALGNGR